MTMVDIAFGGTLGTVYKPACIKVKTGTQVTFNGSFTNHPLLAGVVAGGVATPAMAGTTPLPTTAVNTGTTSSYMMTTAGTYGYYCTKHAVSMMMYGAIIVQ
jgi:plastocyanin